MFITPSTLPAVEENIDLNIVITANANVGAITSVSATCSALGNIVITVGQPSGINGNCVITVTGRYNDNFNKSITYEDENKAVQNVSRFKDITPNYNFISNYTAAGGGTAIAVYTITINGTSYTLNQTINNSSFTPGKEYVIQYVAQGKY